MITGVFLLGMMQKVCFGPLNEKWKGLSDMTVRGLLATPRDLERIRSSADALDARSAMFE